MVLFHRRRHWGHILAAIFAAKAPLQPKLLCSLNFGCWFLAATGVGVPPSFLTNLGGGGTDVPMRTPIVGAGESHREEYIGIGSDRATSVSPLQTGTSRG